MAVEDHLLHCRLPFVVELVANVAAHEGLRSIVRWVEFVDEVVAIVVVVVVVVVVDWRNVAAPQCSRRTVVVRLCNDNQH